MQANNDDSSSIMTIERIRHAAGIFFGTTMVVLAVINVLVAFASGRSLLLTAVLSAAAAIACLTAIRIYKTELPARIVTAVAFGVQMITLIYAASSLSPEYVQEAHMMYFIVNAFMVFYLCWRSLLVYNLVVVVHHLVLTFVLPSIIWSDVSTGEALIHLTIHALIVMVALPPLLLAAVKFEQALRNSVQATAEAKSATADALEMAERAESSRKATIEEQQKSDILKSRTEKAQRIVVENLARGLDALASGNLTIRLDTPFPDEFDRLRTDFNRSVEQLEEAMCSISNSSSVIRSGAAEIRSGSSELSERTERQAAAVEETTAALAEITQSVRESCRSAEDAGSLVAAASGNAESSSLIVGEAVAAMGEIERSSSQITNITAVIDDIAFQTNLLALNAGVEAARAGEAGKGFAVVAQEVRGLAQRSSEAAREIKQLITLSDSQVKQGVNLVNQTGEALHKIVVQIREISGNVSAIVDVSTRQSTSLQEINVAMSSVDQGTQQNAAMAEESNAACLSLNGEVDNLNVLLAKFQTRQAASIKTPHNRQVASKRGGQSKPTVSPAREMIRKVAGAFGGSRSAAPASASWEEF